MTPSSGSQRRLKGAHSDDANGEGRLVLAHRWSVVLRGVAVCARNQLMSWLQRQRFPRYTIFRCKIMGPSVIGLLTWFESGER